jgi:hypothetical protein
MTAEGDRKSARWSPAGAWSEATASAPSCWINTVPVECMKYACHLTAKYHGPELFDLAEDELAVLMRDVARAAKALRTVTMAVKINYEIHGNTVPHLHVHLYPRFRDDPFPTGRSTTSGRPPRSMLKASTGRSCGT